jgi:cytochrome c553
MAVERHAPPGAGRSAGARAARTAAHAIRIAALLFAAGLVQAQPSAATLAACGACHGENGGAPLPNLPTLAGQPALFLENQLVLIREGLRDVPTMKALMDGLTDADIVAIARHFAALPIRPAGGARDAAKARAGEQVAARMLCGTCHLPSYQGQAQVPRLAGQQEAYLQLTMKQFRDAPAPGRDTLMNAALLGASDADLGNLAHFLATLTAAP